LEKVRRAVTEREARREKGERNIKQRPDRREENRKKEEKTAENGKGDRERETDSVEREGTEKVGISIGRPRDIDGEKEEKGTEGANRQRGEDTDWCLYTWRRGTATVIGLPSHRHRNTTKNGHQHHRQLSHPRSSPQVILLPLIAAGHYSSSCLQNMHCARSACKKK
jgi:hypothetical protein